MEKTPTETGVRRKELVVFGAVFAAAVLLSPFAVMYELVLGGLGVLVSAFVVRRGGRRARTAFAVFAGIAAGSVPYLLAALFL